MVFQTDSFSQTWNVLELCKWQKLLLQDTRNKLPIADFSYHPPKISYGQWGDSPPPPMITLESPPAHNLSLGGDMKNLQRAICFQYPGGVIFAICTVPKHSKSEKMNQSKKPKTSKNSENMHFFEKFFFLTFLCFTKLQLFSYVP